MIAGGAILARLHGLGVKQVFVNSGTDFPPLIEGMAKAAHLGMGFPTPVIVPHEHVAMGMAHGYYLLSGQTPVVMLHTNVGLANGASGMINAACENVPLILMSGRTPVTETGRFGARTVPIGWGQEMRDQAALVRESCKWDYELRFPEQIGELIDRAHAIANSTPKGPVYLSLPREILCEDVSIDDSQQGCRFSAAVSSPSRQHVKLTADWISKARNPLIVAQRGPTTLRGFRILERLAENWAIPVCTWWATSLPLSTEHMCFIGSNPSPWLERADLVLVINSLAPWWPDAHPVGKLTRVVQLGPDPLFSRFPVRNFRADLALTGETDRILGILECELEQTRPPDSSEHRDRRSRISESSHQLRTQRRSDAVSTSRGSLTKDTVSLALGEALRGLTSSVFSELGVSLDLMRRQEFNSWFQEPFSGGLGWSLPAALGARLADPHRLCVATMGDGSYMFANPVAAHQVSCAQNLPVLTIVLNNREWGAVRSSVMELYPHGYASRANQVPLTALEPSPDYSAVARACGARAFRVDMPEKLMPALESAIREVTEAERQALVEVAIERG